MAVWNKEEVTFKMTLHQQGEDTDKSKGSEALTLPNEQSREPRVFVVEEVVCFGWRRAGLMNK